MPVIDHFYHILVCGAADNCDIITYISDYFKYYPAYLLNKV